VSKVYKADTGYMRGLSVYSEKWSL